MNLPKYSSQFLILLILVLTGWFGMGTLLLSTLFAYFALDKLTCLKRKWLTLLAFSILVSVICFGLVYMGSQAVHLPHAAEKSIQKMIDFAMAQGLELPFSDWDSMKAFALDTVKDEIHFVGLFTKTASKQFVFIIIGGVIAVNLFLNPSADLKESYSIRNNLYSVIWMDLSARFRFFYSSFKTVISAQLIIATINAGLTAIFLTCISMPYGPMLVAITFFSGLLPIIGNLISNTIIVCIGFTVSPELGLGALAFLIILHKLEYFLNSKIIGERIKNPVWLTLIALIVGERVLGITGMILAPVVLYYLKMEASQIQVGMPEEETRPGRFRRPRY